MQDQRPNIPARRQSGPRLPDFVVIGAQKCGTTWLARNLRQHPDVFMPRREVRYFDRERHFRLGTDWYADWFAEADGARMVGEKGADYLWVSQRRVGDHLPDIPRRMHRLLPDARLIAILRDPVDRAISSARHYLRLGKVPPRFTIDSLLVGRHRAVGERLGLIQRGQYLPALQAYLRHYDRSRLLVLIYEEDVAGDPHAALERVCRFVGVDPSFTFPDAERPIAATRWSRPAMWVRRYLPATVHRSLPRLLEERLAGDPPEPHPETLRRLAALYRPHNERLYAFLGRVPDGWPPP